MSSNQLNITRLLSVVLLMPLSAGVFAQQTLKGNNSVINISGMDAFGAQRFYIDIYQRSNSVTVKYAYHDSVKHSEVRKDCDYQRISKKRQQYETGDPRRDLLSDSLGLIFKKISAYTRDSMVMSLKQDTAYSNLLQRFSKSSKEELAPKIKRSWLDGYTIWTTIITDDRNIEIHTDTPGDKTHPLLMSFIRHTLNKRKESEAVKKILNSYVEYK